MHPIFIYDRYIGFYCNNRWTLYESVGINRKTTIISFLTALINRGNLLRKYDEFKLVSDKVEESLMNYKYSTVYNYVIKYLQG